MIKPKLATVKIEIRFDTELGARDCLPSAHDVVQEKFGLKPDSYMVIGYDIDPEDQESRVVSFLVGVE